MGLGLQKGQEVGSRSTCFWGEEDYFYSGKWGLMSAEEDF